MHAFEKHFNWLLYLLVFTILFTGCEAEIGTKIYNVTFLIDNNTNHKILVNYDYISRDCEVDCRRQEISDIINSDAKFELFITDEIRLKDDIETIFNRFEIYKDNGTTLSDFDFWDSEKLSAIEFTDRYEYTLKVDDDFFQ